MKLFTDIFPVLLFFIAYKLYGIYIATGVAIAASIGQVAYTWLKHRKVETLQWIMLLLIAILGGATLFFHNESFIKWKPTVVNWVLAIAFLGSQFFTNKPFIQTMLENKIELPQLIWSRLNLSWGLFFFVMGLVNIYVLEKFSTDTWVNFKLFGMLGATFIFTLIQGISLARYSQNKPQLIPPKS